jgi:hypothetical protein
MTAAPRQSLDQPPKVPIAADLLGPQEVLQIQDLGTYAYREGRSVSVCPWADAQTPDDLARQKMWISGFARGRTELRQARDHQQPE